MDALNGQVRHTQIPTADGKASSARERQAEGWRRLIDFSGIPPSYHMAHMRDLEAVEGDREKASAVEVMRAYAESGKIDTQGYDQYCLLLSGGFGTGKTHAATAVFKDRLWKASNNSAMWRKYPAFIREVQSTYSAAADRTVQQVLAAYQKTPLLLLDDVGDLTMGSETDDRRRLVYEVIDYRNDHFLPTIITTNLNGAQLEEQFGERTWERIRFMCCLLRMEGTNLRRQPLTEMTD